ncbi:hypothetical protein M408DRAFT_333514 [Serendipita vermifera MAFF 305830]|uniref:Uncharacterized protein n=1 Tax=Serendipita vermifera MAFF 305830 TaxID=933852 RepID=A0A0C3A9Q3_SERVB|nr:hypothetical protein M408DRAFT_333514 [Serendipita vermifera MAFF 305830]
MVRLAAGLVLHVGRSRERVTTPAQRFNLLRARMCLSAYIHVLSSVFPVSCNSRHVLCNGNSFES